MKKSVLVVTFFILINSLYAQSINQKITLLPNEKKDLFFVTNKGDDLFVEIKRLKGEKLSAFSLQEFKNNVELLEGNNIKKYKENITATTGGIYQIHLKNNKSKASTVSIEIVVNSFGKPLPKLHYAIHRDTTYGYLTNQYKVTEKLKAQKIQQEEFYLNSRSNVLIKGGKNRIIVPVNLPENTVSWHYVFTASRNNEEVQNTINTFNLATALTQRIEKQQSIAAAISNLSPPPGADICDVYLLDEKNALLFKRQRRLYFFCFWNSRKF